MPESPNKLLYFAEARFYDADNRTGLASDINWQQAGISGEVAFAAASLLPTGSSRVLDELGINSLPKFASGARNPLIWGQAFTIDTLRKRISWAKLFEQTGWITRIAVDKFFDFSGS